MPEINNTDKAENLEQSTVLGKMVKMRYVRFWEFENPMNQ